MKKLYNLILMLLISTFTLGQSIIPIAFDLSAPTDVNIDAEGNLWVVTLGTGADDGQVYRIQPNGEKEVVVDSLPSLFDPETQELAGVLSARYESDGFIYVVQGAGLHEFSGSILIYSIADYEILGRPLMVSEFRSRISVSDFVLASGFEESNPYSFLEIADGYIIVDAAANALITYNRDADSLSVLAEFPSLVNPLPFGPPFVDVVPTKILANGDTYLVSCLTGFPFADGVSNIYEVDAAGNVSIYLGGFTLITDMERATDGGLYVQQFGRFGQGDMGPTFLFGSAQLMRIDEMGGRDTVLSGYGPSAGFAIGEDGQFYMSHLFLGQVLKGEISTAVEDIPRDVISQVFPNPVTDQLTLLMDAPLDIDELVIYDVYGRRMLGYAFQTNGNQIEIMLDNSFASGPYFIQFSSEKGSGTTSFIKL